MTMSREDQHEREELLLISRIIQHDNVIGYHRNLCDKILTLKFQKLNEMLTLNLTPNEKLTLNLKADEIVTLEFKMLQLKPVRTTDHNAYP